VPGMNAGSTGLTWARCVGGGGPPPGPRLRRLWAAGSITAGLGRGV